MIEFGAVFAVGLAIGTLVGVLLRRRAVHLSLDVNGDHPARDRDR